MTVTKRKPTVRRAKFSLDMAAEKAELKQMLVTIEGELKRLQTLVLLSLADGASSTIELSDSQPSCVFKKRYELPDRSVVRILYSNNNGVEVLRIACSAPRIPIGEWRWRKRFDSEELNNIPQLSARPGVLCSLCKCEPNLMRRIFNIWEIGWRVVSPDDCFEIVFTVPELPYLH